MVTPRDAQIPWFIMPFCIATAVILIASGIPLAQRRVPPNSLFGVRIPATMRDERVWYEVNAIVGRHLVRIGALYLCCIVAVQLFGASWDPALRILAPVVVLVLSMLVETILIFRVTRRVVRSS